MSGIETVKIIVNAEKEAAKILDDAQKKATEIRKQLNTLIQQQREEILNPAKKEATSIVEDAEKKGKDDAENHGRESQDEMIKTISKASAKKDEAVTRLVNIILKGKA